ncbi:hypothetical protein [Mesobacillus stamsii]|uniref:Uncharacterized protein n=1 Tax=Mesobacillus stamsii TaxID=225347 RepID=A0ABU0FV87_9BACI|nr:hypothetical protein [Mesobacillus stamsii]MDQ0413824.1 hypothetical protein [Mesobacillus stamsii]
MDTQERPAEWNQELFYDVMKRAFEKGTNSKEITIQKLIEDLIFDLKAIHE